MSDWFDELSTTHRDFVNASRRMNVNLDALLENNYADPTHFVYELLQNAEDQGATCVEFTVDADQLMFVHNGSPFRRQDVDSITNIANSTKTGVSNKIGCFGIGFKSVFDVADRPRIYSTLEDEPFAFAIEDKFVPVRLSCPAGFLKPQETRFVFPFKAGQEADIYTKIQRKLRDLGPETLLFLDNLEEIHWRGTTEEGVYLCERKDPTSGDIDLMWEKGLRGERKETKQAHFVRYSTTSDFTRGSGNLKVSLAFRIEKGHVVPEQGLSVLHVFFPTREKTNLKFLLHAPMLLTASRDNVRDTEENKHLVQTCARLLAETLPKLRDAGYLDTDCLNCLPVRPQDFPEGTFFRLLYEAVRRTLSSKVPLLPTAAGSSRPHVTKDYGKISESGTTRGLLKEAQLTDLHGSDTTAPFCWLEEKIRQKATADLWFYLQRELGVAEIDLENFAGMITEPFLTKQDDAWLTQFYIALLDTPSLWNRPNTRLRRKEIIRLEDSTHVVPFDDTGRPNAYLPTGSRSKVNTVRLGIYQDEKAREFLISLGLTAPAATDEVIRLILPSYKQSPPPEYKRQEYALQLQTIANAINSCLSAEVAELRSCLLETPFLLVYNFVSGGLAWSDPIDDVYIHSQELKTWFDGNKEAYFLHNAVLDSSAWPVISKFLNTRQQEEMLVFTSSLCIRAKTSGRYDTLVLKYAKRRHCMTEEGFDPDCRIDGLEYALQNINLARAQMLWNLLVKNTHLVQGPVLEATRSDYLNATRTIEMSEVGKLCSKREWLPASNGVFYHPSKLLLSDLPAGFDKTSDAASLLSVQLGMKQVVKTQQDIEAEKFGLSASVLEYIKSNPAKITELVLQMQTPKPVSHFPSDENATFAQRRADKIQQEAQNAPEVKPQVKPRIIRHPSSIYKVEARAYMQNKYKNDQGHMFCQICEQAMPFELSDGNPYFELVQYIKKWPKETIRHFLALCPTCAAKYLYVNSTSPDVLHDAAINVDLEAGNFRIPVRLANKECTIRFTKGHLTDLKNTLIGMTAQGDVDDTA